MPELGTYGSERGAPSNGCPYRDQLGCADLPTSPQGPTTTLSVSGQIPLETTRGQPSGPLPQTSDFLRDSRTGNVPAKVP
jgi:hypothetical protein